MDFGWLYEPLEALDEALAGGLDGSGLLVLLGAALLLGLRHATDPDHVLAITAMVAADDAGPRDAARIGAWWGAGHAAVLLVVGLVLIAGRTEVPAGVERAAEMGIGVLIAALSLRALWRLARRRRDDAPATGVRTRRQAAAIGVLHGLGGTGAIVLLLVAAIPDRAEAAAALLVFAPMSVASMAACTFSYASIAGLRGVRDVLVPLLAVLGVAFGVWYAGAA